MKPFAFAAFRAKLEQYAAYRAQLTDGPVAQDDVDRMFGSLRAASGPGGCRRG